MIDYETIYNQAWTDAVWEFDGRPRVSEDVGHTVALAAVVSAAKAEAATGTITIPTPHVTYGPKDVPENVADADYLRSAVGNIDYLSHGERIWGSGVTATVRKLLLDAAQALDPKAATTALVAKLVRAE